MRLLVATVLTAVLLSPAARAQTAPTANDQEAARAHFMAGSAYYEQANYGDAVKEFNEAYRLSQRPDLLYNIALAYERLGKLDEAIDALGRYLKDKPDAQDRGIIQTRIENLEKRRDAARDAVEAQPAPPPLVTAAPVAPKKPRHVASYVVGGIGVAALLASIGTGATALSIQSDVDSKCQHMICPSSERNQVAEGKALALSTDIMIGIGAAAVLVGVVLFVVESRRPARTSWLGPTQDGLSVQF